MVFVRNYTEIKIGETKTIASKGFEPVISGSALCHWFESRSIVSKIRCSFPLS